MYSLKFFLVFLLVCSFVSALPSPTGYVNDFAQIFSPEDLSRLTALAENIYVNTTVQIAIVTLPSLEGQPIEQTAIDLFSAWGIGDEERDNGLLILVVPAERTYRIEVGYGLEGILNDAKVGRIAREYFVPSFQQGQYGEGIYQGLLVIHSLLQGEEEAVASSESLSPLYFIGAVLWFSVFLTLSFVFKAKKKQRAQNVLGTVHILLSIFAYFISVVLFIWMLVLLVLYAFIIIGTSAVSGGRPRHHFPGPFMGRGGFGRSGGGFGGFGGGMSGGGGASGRF